MKTLASLLVCCVLSLSSTRAQDQEYSFKENYTVSLPAQLVVSSSDGNIDVVPSEGNEIKVLYIVKKNNHLVEMNREELEKEMILEVAKSTSGVVIRIQNKVDHWKFNFKDRIHVNFKIYVPKTTSCDLVTSDGNISLEGVTSDQHCKTSDGNIHITDIAGNVTGHTSDGNIGIKGITGSVEVGTSDGNIHLENIRGDVQSTTSDGNIDLLKITGNTSVRTSDGHISFKELSGSFKAHTSDGSIRGNMIELKNQLAINTGDGNIDVTIPANLGLDLDIKGESLHVPLNNFSGKSDEKFIHGKSNGGGIAVTLSTSDGNVTITYL